eukprot:c14493_g1_i2.p1 GENE.c14493_g1_i2~~c14493_g1_i2.p1  ORF type:complete len:717 (+),score=143.24 c14493_g1_i2:311-2152(+)
MEPVVKRFTPKGSKEPLSADFEEKLRVLKIQFDATAPTDGRLSRNEFFQFCADNDVDFDADERKIVLADGVAEWDEMEDVLRKRYRGILDKARELQARKAKEALEAEQRRAAEAEAEQGGSDENDDFIARLKIKFTEAVPEQGRMPSDLFRRFCVANNLKFDAMERNFLLADNFVHWGELEEVLRKREDPSKMGPVVMRSMTQTRTLTLGSLGSSEVGEPLSADLEEYLSLLRSKFDEAAPDGRLNAREFDQYCDETSLEFDKIQRNIFLADGVVEWKEIEMVLRKRYNKPARSPSFKEETRVVPVRSDTGNSEAHWETLNERLQQLKIAFEESAPDGYLDRPGFRNFCLEHSLELDTMDRNFLLADNRAEWDELEAMLRKKWKMLGIDHGELGEMGVSGLTITSPDDDGDGLSTVRTAWSMADGARVMPPEDNEDNESVGSHSSGGSHALASPRQQQSVERRHVIDLEEISQPKKQGSSLLRERAKASARRSQTGAGVAFGRSWKDPPNSGRAKSASISGPASSRALDSARSTSSRTGPAPSPRLVGTSTTTAASRRSTASQHSTSNTPRASPTMRKPLVPGASSGSSTAASPRGGSRPGSLKSTGKPADLE